LESTLEREGTSQPRPDQADHKSPRQSPICARVFPLVRERVVAARRRQQERFAGKRNVTCNARMGTRDLKAFCALDEPTLELLKMAMNELKLSARAYDRILKVARTIADLAESEKLTSEHISEAIQYRSLDRQLWA